MNLPNSITLVRIVCIPVLVWVMTAQLFGRHAGERELIAAALFVFASATDGLDGYLARKRKQVSNMGILLDPLADKLLIAAGLILLIPYNPRIMPPWIVMLILGREFLISGLRSVAADEGFSIAASDLGKIKMVLQVVVVVAAILDHGWREWSFGGFILGVDLIAQVAVWFMVALTVLSAVDYFWGFWRRISLASNEHLQADVAQQR